MGLVLRNDAVWYTGLVASASNALLLCLAKLQETGDWRWQLAAAVIVVVGAPWWKKMVGRELTRKERKMWRELFGEQTAWEMLINDPRLKTWRQPR